MLVDKEIGGAGAAGGWESLRGVIIMRIMKLGCPLLPKLSESSEKNQKLTPETNLTFITFSFLILFTYLSMSIL